MRKWISSTVFALTAAITSFAQAPSYDLVLRGGHVIDPLNNLDAVRDVAVKDGRIAAVAESIAADGAKKAIDVAGLYVTPGLVDIHIHVAFNWSNAVVNAGSDSVVPDHNCLRAGVTTAVDAGTYGWRFFEEFRRRALDNSKVRLLTMINIAGYSMPDNLLEQNPEDLDPKKTAEMAKNHKDIVVAIKSAHWRAPNFLSVEKAVEAATLADLPVMVDFGFFLPERPYRQMITDILRPGDMSTHFYRWPAPLLDGEGKVAQFLQVGRTRGVKFDVGHGGGSFHFPNAEPAVRQGFWPDSISTDLHAGSVNGAMIDMLNVMSKFLAMGVPLPEVIRQSTSNPAAQIRRPDLGHLAVGAEADIAVLRLDRGDFGFVDVKGGRITGRERLGCEMTIRGGDIVFDFNGRAGIPWRNSGIEYPDK